MRSKLVQLAQCILCVDASAVKNLWQDDYTIHDATDSPPHATFRPPRGDSTPNCDKLANSLRSLPKYTCLE